MQSYCFFKAEQKVKIMNRLPACSFQQIVYHGNYKQFISILLKVYKTFVCIYHLFQIRILICDKSE